MSALQPLTLAAGSSATSCTPPDMRIVTSVNAKYDHVLVNQISHIHHMDCAPPIEYHCTDEASFNLCETLAVESDTATCVLADCPNCNTREGISFLKFYLLRDALRREMPSGEGASGVLYIDATALVQGASCLNELVATDTDVAVSAEDMSPGCPLNHVLADVGVHGLNANTGLIWARRTEEAEALLNDLIGRYEEVGSKGNTLCPEQAFFGNYLNTHGTREAAVGSAPSMSLQVAYNATRVAYDGQPARVTILDYARWPRFLVEDARAYASWPPALQARVTSKMQSTRGENATEREELGHTVALDATTGGPREVCLYHPFVRGTKEKSTEGRGSQAVFFAKDGMWYL